MISFSSFRLFVSRFPWMKFKNRDLAKASFPFVSSKPKFRPDISTIISPVDVFKKFDKVEDLFFSYKSFLFSKLILFFNFLFLICKNVLITIIIYKNIFVLQNLENSVIS